MQRTVLALLLTSAAALAPQQAKPKAAVAVDRRAVGAGLLTTIGAFSATAANAAAGESPKFSFFGIGGNSETYSEGAAYGMDQSAKVYSPYSVYGKLGAPDAVYKNRNQGETDRKKVMLTENAIRVAKINQYIEKKQWEEVRAELQRQVYEMRGAMNYLAVTKESKQAAKQFYQDMERVQVFSTRKNQASAMAAYDSMMTSLAAYQKTI